MIRKYLILTKPGIIFGNLITALAGFFLASKGVIDGGLLVSMLFGLSLTIASACVVNNYMDRQIDLKMERTKKRALANGTLSPKSALIYAALLGFGGSYLLVYFTNKLTFLVAMSGFITYVFAYGYYKRRSNHGTFIGSFAGATPPVVGYISVTNQFDAAALILFVMLICWQMSHFFAIAIFRKKDYQKAKIPVMPVVKGELKTARLMIFYGGLFLLSSISLYIFGYAGLFYLVWASALGIYWLYKIILGLHTADSIKWARGVFKVSLIVITVLSIVISIDSTISGNLYNSNMIVLVHVLSALASIAAATFLYLSPSKVKMQLAYVLIAATIASGTVLVLTLHVNMLKTCVTGLAYILAMTAAVLTARRRLAGQQN